MKNNELKNAYLTPLCKVFTIHTQGVVCSSFTPNELEGFSEDLFTL